MPSQKHILNLRMPLCQSLILDQQNVTQICRLLLAMWMDFLNGCLHVQELFTGILILLQRLCIYLMAFVCQNHLPLTGLIVLIVPITPEAGLVIAILPCLSSHNFQRHPLAFHLVPLKIQHSIFFFLNFRAVCKP